jgi:hypothetical protein
MTSIRKSMMVFLPLALLAGCDATVPAGEELPGAASAQALTGFTFDTTGIARPPSGDIPADRLTQAAFDDAVIARSLIQTTEPFALGMRLGDINEQVAASWKFEKAPAEGALLVLKTAPTGPAVTVDEAVLQRSATARLASWGLPASETGRVLQRKSLSQDADGTAIAAERVHRYKTFVHRAINGVPVEGHRAVVTHGLDGSFVRAYIKWPALAASGHLLHSRVSATEIQSRAAAALRTEGETSGVVKLRYKYVPTALTTGEVTLTLKVGARLVPDRTATNNSEAREVDVDVDALP